MSSAPLRSVTLYLVGLVAIFFWWGAPDRIGRPHYPDLFHYYIGTKYFSELQYTHLYECAAKADLKSDTPTLSSSTPIRDLRTNLVSSDAAFDSEQCPTFEKKRWDGFLADIVWFRTKLGAGWHKVFLDHGFNASPYWVSVAQLLIPDGAVSDGLIKRLVRIDLCLIAAIWICIGLFFSAETFAVAAIVWGCNPIANSLWTGGGFLRHDWLLFLVLSTIALRYKRYKLSGAVFAISCCSRIFPVVAAAIWCALALLRKSDNDRRSYLTFLSSFVATCAIATLFVVTQIESSSWRGFLSNSVKHTTTRSGNLIGLPHVVDHLLSCRFGDAGLQPKSCDLDNLRVDSPVAKLTTLVTVLCSLALFIWYFVKRSAYSENELFGIALLFIPLLTSLSSYYFEFLILLPLLLPNRKFFLLALVSLLIVFNFIFCCSPSPNKNYLIGGVLLTHLILLSPVILSFKSVPAKIS